MSTCEALMTGKQTGYICDITAIFNLTAADFIPLSFSQTQPHKLKCIKVTLERHHNKMDGSSKALELWNAHRLIKIDLLCTYSIFQWPCCYFRLCLLCIKSPGRYCKYRRVGKAFSFRPKLSFKYRLQSKHSGVKSLSRPLSPGQQKPWHWAMPK